MSADKNNNGFGVIEVLICCFLISVFTISTTSLIIFIQNSLSDITKREEVTNYVIEQLNKDRQVAQYNFSSLSSSSWYDQGIEFSKTVNNISEDVKDVVLTALWDRNKYLTMRTQLYNWAGFTSKNICDLDGIVNNGSIEKIIDLPETTIPTDVIIRNQKAYITSNTGTQSNSDLLIIDLNENRIIDEIDSGPGVNNIVLVGNKAYLGNTSINSQLQIIDLPPLNGGTLISQFKLPGNYNDNSTIAQSLSYARGNTYLGTRKSEIQELHILDTKDPFRIKELGTYELNSAVNSIYRVKEGVLLASPSDPELKLISDSNQPSIIKSFDAQGGSGNGKSIATNNTSIILGRTLGGDELQILNKDLSLRSSLNLDTSITGLVADEENILLSTTDIGKEIKIINLSDLTIVKEIGINSTPTNIKCGFDNKAYFVTQNPPRLYIIK